MHAHPDCLVWQAGAQAALAEAQAELDALKAVMDGGGAAPGGTEAAQQAELEDDLEGDKENAQGGVRPPARVPTSRCSTAIAHETHHA
jgi:hypothetical protein